MKSWIKPEEAARLILEAQEYEPSRGGSRDTQGVLDSKEEPLPIVRRFGRTALPKSDYLTDWIGDA